MWVSNVSARGVVSEAGAEGGTTYEAARGGPEAVRRPLRSKAVECRCPKAFQACSIARAPLTV